METGIYQSGVRIEERSIGLSCTMVYLINNSVDVSDHEKREELYQVRAEMGSCVRNGERERDVIFACCRIVGGKFSKELLRRDV